MAVEENVIRGVDVAIIFATIAGPILAVQAQKWLEKGRIINERRNAIFRTLMATRAALLSPVHIEALNTIPLEFYGNAGKLKDINDSWKLFLDHHVPGLPTSDDCLQKRQDLFLDLLHLISEFLGYQFIRSQLDRDIYSPKAHGDLESEQTIIRKGFVKLFSGESALPMEVTKFPSTVDQKTFDNQAALTGLLMEWLAGQRAVKVENPDKGTEKEK